MIVELQSVENVVNGRISRISFQHPKSSTAFVIHRKGFVPLSITRKLGNFAYLHPIAEPSLSGSTYTGREVVTRIRACRRLPDTMNIILGRSIP